MKLWLSSDGTWSATAVAGSKAVEVPWEKRETLAAWLTEIGAGKTSEQVKPPERSQWETQAELRHKEIEKALGIEEEIQNCDLPRLAVLASNVAYRFAELARKGEVK